MWERQHFVVTIGQRWAMAIAAKSGSDGDGGRNWE